MDIYKCPRNFRRLGLVMKQAEYTVPKPLEQEQQKTRWEQTLRSYVKQTKWGPDLPILSNSSPPLAYSRKMYCILPSFRNPKNFITLSCFSILWTQTWNKQNEVCKLMVQLHRLSKVMLPYLPKVKIIHWSINGVIPVQTDQNLEVFFYMNTVNKSIK